MKNITIREAKNHAIPLIVNIHINSLPNTFLTDLGRNFLLNIFYPLVIESKNCIVLVAERNNRIVALMVMALDKNQFNIEMKIIRRGIIKSLIVQMLHKPRIIFEALNILIGPKVQLISSEFKLKAIPKIVILAVSPEVQGKSFGSKLLHTGLDRLWLEKDSENRFCQVEALSEGAIRFYRKNRFINIGIEKRGKKNFQIFLYMP